MNRSRLVQGTALAAFLTMVSVGSASAQTLMDAFMATYQNNPTIQAERSSLRTTDEGVPQAVGRWRPTVELLNQAAIRRENSGFTTGEDTRRQYSTILEVNQNLYEGGGTTYRIKQAEAEVEAARSTLMETEQAVLLDAATAFMNVVRDQAIVDLNKRNERRLERQLEATRDRFEVGEVTRTDVAQAESRLAGAQADRIASEGDLEVSRAFYQQIVGELPGLLQAPVDHPDVPVSREEALTLATDRNPTVRAAEKTYEAADVAVRVQAASLLPSVDLTAQLGREYSRSGSNDTDSDLMTLTGNLTVPIYQQGIVSSQVREARQAAIEARDLVVEARRSVLENATSAWETYVSAVAQISAREAEVRATEIALEGVEQEAAVGSRTVLDVLDAEQELLDAQVNLVEAQRNETVARYDLIQSVGGLTAREMGLTSNLYDPEAYYKSVRDKAYDSAVWDEIFKDDDQ
ncbi:MAG: TolC family outer membrane protein [Alphaproteobacteria bacterium]